MTRTQDKKVIGFGTSGKFRITTGTTGFLEEIQWMCSTVCVLRGRWLWCIWSSTPQHDIHASPFCIYNPTISISTIALRVFQTFQNFIPLSLSPFLFLPCYWVVEGSFPNAIEPSTRFYQELLFLDNICVLFGGLLQGVTKMPALVNYRGKFALYSSSSLLKKFNLCVWFPGNSYEFFIVSGFDLWVFLENKIFKFCVLWFRIESLT